METLLSLDKCQDQYLLRLETELDSLSLLNWLKNQHCDTKIYWACRQKDIEVAGIGIADSIDITNTTSFERAVLTIEDRLKRSTPQMRYYGGCCFDPENIDLSEWKGFGQYRFVVPEYEVVRKYNSYTLAHNVRTTCNMDTEKLKQELLEFANQTLSRIELSDKTALEGKINGGSARKDFPARPEWVSLAKQLIEAIQAARIEKVVLAQKADVVSAHPFNPVTLLERMKNLSSQTYTFLYQFPDSGVFLGASPECLFRKDGRTVYSEAIAGTRPMSPNQTINLQLQKELQESAKELQEHEYVTDNIRAALQMICDDVISAERQEILQTASVQHLYTRFQGKLLNDINLYHVFNALHPTAAVNGTPPQKATEQIQLLEPFSRGWYAGAVGWIMSQQAEFAVAIRSALVQQQQTISVYSGAGIVKDSDPEQEWEETELKKRLILEAAKEIL